MLKKRKSSLLKNEKGMAMLEMIPILVVIVLFVNFSLGFWSHSHGNFHSIAARNYVFETFRNRSNLTYFRSNDASALSYHYDKLGMRGAWKTF